MKRLTSSLRREWDAKLKASGFQDLECPGGGLSARGTIVVTGDYTHNPTPEARVETEAYYDNAREILRSHRFATRQDRQIWEIHTERPDHTGTLRAYIASILGITQWEVRRSIARTESETAAISHEGSSPINPSRATARERVARMVRRLDVELLVTLGRLLA